MILMIVGAGLYILGILSGVLGMLFIKASVMEEEDG